MVLHIFRYPEAKGKVPNNLESYRPGEITRRNAGTFAFDEYECFQHKMERVAVSINIQGAHSRVDFAAAIFRLCVYV